MKRFSRENKTLAGNENKDKGHGYYNAGKLQESVIIPMHCLLVMFLCYIVESRMTEKQNELQDLKRIYTFVSLSIKYSYGVVL